MAAPKLHFFKLSQYSMANLRIFIIILYALAIFSPNVVFADVDYFQTSELPPTDIPCPTAPFFPCDGTVSPPSSSSTPTPSSVTPPSSSSVPPPSPSTATSFESRKPQSNVYFTDLMMTPEQVRECDRLKALYTRSQSNQGSQSGQDSQGFGDSSGGSGGRFSLPQLLCSMVASFGLGMLVTNMCPVRSSSRQQHASSEQDGVEEAAEAAEAARAREQQSNFRALSLLFRLLLLALALSCLIEYARASAKALSEYQAALGTVRLSVRHCARALSPAVV
jgi:hypothetical protein